MNPFENTEKAISQDVKEVFEEIWQEIHSNYFVSGKHDLTYIREAVCKYLPTTIINKNLLLFDTVVNYLTKDARNALENKDSKIINEFFERNRQWTENFKNQFKSASLPTEITLSLDARTKYGAFASAGGAGIGATAVIARELLGKVAIEGIVAEKVLLAWLVPAGLTVLIAGGVGYLAYKWAYRVSTPTATEETKEDIRKYLQQEEKETLNRLLDVVEKYKQDFK